MNIENPVNEGFIPFRGYKTWYRSVGKHEEPGKSALVCLHGGPGATHDYLTPLEVMSSRGRRVIFYDQLGWGNSDHVNNPSLWSIELFLEEFGEIRKALNLEHVHILGHSWGGMLAMEYALSRPEGLSSLILSDTTASTRQWIAETKRLLSFLSEEVQQTIRNHEAAGTTDSLEYVEACKAFSRQHAGGHIDPKPEWVKKAFEKLSDNEVYLTMWGPSEFCVTGSLKEWDITPRLSEILVPTLIIAGRYDEATPVLAEALRQGITGSELVIFENSAHFPHIEETESYLQILDRFLSQVEGGNE